MEERLFWIGIGMGAYAWATRRGIKSGVLDTRWRTAFWHALFFSLAGFALTMVGILSIESRSRFSSVAAGTFGAREFWPSLAGGALLGFFGFWRAFREGGRGERRGYFLGEDLEWADTVFSAVLLASFLMYFVVQAFKIPSGSMESTLLIGDHLFVNKFIYGVRIPLTDKRVLRMRSVRRGDIVVFRFPTDDKEASHCGSPQYGKDFIKRVIGLPGDTVEVRAGEVFVDGRPLGSEPYTQYLDAARLEKPFFPMSAPQYQALWERAELDRNMGDGMRDYFGPITVPAGSYFVMGDNRDRSCDGRYWGPVWERYLKGKAWVIYWPPSRMRGIS